MDVTVEETRPTNERALSKTERRKTSKPVMEKKRRERINKSLDELKNLLLESRKKGNSRCSKLEKADILEMTVQHLKAIRAQQKNIGRNDPVAMAHYKAGFNQSAAEISRYLVNAQDIEVEVRTRLLTHLSNNLQSVLGNQPPVGHITTSCQNPTPTIRKQPLESAQFSPTLTSPGVVFSAVSTNYVHSISSFTEASDDNTSAPTIPKPRDTYRDGRSAKPVHYTPQSESNGPRADPPIVWRPW